MTTLAVLAVFSPVILITLVAIAGVLVVWFVLFIVRALFWLAIGGLIGLALWAGEARAQQPLPAKVHTATPFDLVQVYDHLIGSCSPDAKPYGWHDPRRDCEEARVAAHTLQSLGFCQTGGTSGYYWRPGESNQFGGCK